VITGSAPSSAVALGGRVDHRNCYSGHQRIVLLEKSPSKPHAEFAVALRIIVMITKPAFAQARPYPFSEYPRHGFLEQSEVAERRPRAFAASNRKPPSGLPARRLENINSRNQTRPCISSGTVSGLPFERPPARGRDSDANDFGRPAVRR
jgi:hypothetical protein